MLKIIAFLIDLSLIATVYIMLFKMSKDCSDSLDCMKDTLAGVLFKTVRREEDSILLRGLFGKTLIFEDFTTVGINDSIVEYIDCEGSVIIHNKAKDSYYFFANTTPKEAYLKLLEQNPRLN